MRRWEWRQRPSSNVSSRCLPRARADSRVRPSRAAARPRGRLGSMRPRGHAPAPDERTLESAGRGASICSPTFENGRILHSHLRMTGSSGTSIPKGEAWRTPAEQRLAGVERKGTAPCSSAGRCSSCSTALASRSTRPCGASARISSTPTRIEVAVQRARERSPGTRPIGEVLLDQTVAAGSATSSAARRCTPWGSTRGPRCAASPTRRWPRCSRSRGASCRPACARQGTLPRTIYGRKLCPRCGAAVRRRGQGDEARTVHWCAACQLLQTG